MTRGAGAVSATAGVISVLTVLTRLEVLPVRSLASTPESLADGRVWLLASSALVADRPAVASLAGFVVVGLTAVALCGGRSVFIAAALGHVCSAAIVYAAIDLARSVHPSAFENVVAYPDYGTSAIIAAWIGVIAFRLWTRGQRTAAVALPVLAGLVGWLFKGALTVLDVEHVFAFTFGIAAMLPLRLRPVRPRTVATQ